jgi:hypothetical protein
MKKSISLIGMVIILSLFNTHETNAQSIEMIVKAAVVKVIKAVDLQIQRQQNKVIWLQNAHKKLENQMSKFKMDEISDWVEKQRTLYQEYYGELSQVKDVITYYQRIRDIRQKQVLLIQEYNRAWDMLRHGGHFTSEELDYMAKVYSGILGESAKNIDQILLVVESFTTKMGDAQRLEIIDAAADRADTNFQDLARFNQQNLMLSLQRANDHEDMEALKTLYGF